MDQIIWNNYVVWEILGWAFVMDSFQFSQDTALFSVLGTTY
jgi:microcystin-dependent protein